MHDPLFDYLNGLGDGRYPILDDIAIFASGTLSFLLFAAGAAVVALACWRGRSWQANLMVTAQILATLVLTFVMSQILRAMDLLARPFEDRQVNLLTVHEPGSSFPSNHATAALTMALAVGVFASRRWGAALFVPAILISISRIWVGVHWTVDILGALALALLSTYIVHLTTNTVGPLKRAASQRMTTRTPLEP